MEEGIDKHSILEAFEKERDMGSPPGVTPPSTIPPIENLSSSPTPSSATQDSSPGPISSPPSINPQQDNKEISVSTGVQGPAEVILENPTAPSFFYTLNEGCYILVFLIGVLWLSIGLYHPTPLSFALASFFTIPPLLEKHH